MDQHANATQAIGWTQVEPAMPVWRVLRRVLSAQGLQHIALSACGRMPMLREVLAVAHRTRHLMGRVVSVLQAIGWTRAVPPLPVWAAPRRVLSAPVHPLTVRSVTGRMPM